MWYVLPYLNVIFFLLLGLKIGKCIFILFFYQYMVHVLLMVCLQSAYEALMASLEISEYTIQTGSHDPKGFLFAFEEF